MATQRLPFSLFPVLVPLCVLGFWENSYAKRASCGLLPGSTIGQRCRRGGERVVAPIQTAKNGTLALERYRSRPAGQPRARQPARASRRKISPRLTGDSP